MKKTLITIFALGSVAAADITLYDATFAKDGQDTLTSGRSHLKVGTEAITLSSWMIEFQITKQNDIGTFFSTALNATAGVERGGLGIRTYSDTGLSITTSANTAHASAKLTVTKFSELSANNPITLRFAYDAVSHTAYLYNVGTGKYVSATDLTASDTYKLTTVDSSVTSGDVNGKSMFWTDQATATYKLMSITDMSSLAGTEDFLAHVTAPEPTTATLSLLALAGLAARRRRKQA